MTLAVREVMPVVITELRSCHGKVATLTVTWTSDRRWAVDSTLAKELCSIASMNLLEKPILVPNIIKIPFFQDNLVQAGNPNNPTWLERENGLGVHYYTEEFFKQKNKKPKNIITVNNNGLIVRMLENDIGQSIISDHVLTNNINYSKLGEHFKRNFYFLEKHEYGFEELNKLAYQFKISIKNI